MTKSVFRYRFSKSIPMQDVEDALMLAALAVESLHGRSELRLSAKFWLNRKTRKCEIDAGTEVGIHIARIFTGFITDGFGEQCFHVERTEPGKRSPEGQMRTAGAGA